jgi:hypothetical protein
MLVECIKLIPIRDSITWRSSRNEWTDETMVCWPRDNLVGHTNSFQVPPILNPRNYDQAIDQKMSNIIQHNPKPKM